MNYPKNVVMPTSVINLSNMRIAAGPVSTSGIDTKTGLHVVHPATACGIPAELILRMPLEGGQEGACYSACEFTPDENFSSALPNQKIWLGAAGGCTLTNPSLHNPNAVSQLVGYLKTPGTKAGEAVINGWLSPPIKSEKTFSVRMTMTSTQSLVSGTGLMVPLDVSNHADFSGDNPVWTKSHPERLVMPADGIYSIIGMCKFTASPSDANGEVRRLRIYGCDAKKQTFTVIGEAQVPAAGASEISLNVSSHWQFKAGDYMWMEAYQNSGVNMVLNAGPSLMFSKI